MNKKEIRRRILNMRNEILLYEKEKKDTKIFEALKRRKEYIEAKNIFVYIGFGSEINTKDLISDALKEGKRIYVPKVLGKEMIIIEIKNLENLVTGTYGILEPIGEKCDSNVENLDLVIMPGVAFDNCGNRIGYGGGYYDKFLANYNVSAKKIALAYEIQIINNIESEKHDIKVDLIISEDRVISIEK